MFSIVIPTHNRVRLLLDCLEALLQQTLPAHEIIVVDDGSTDNTATMVQAKFPMVIYLHQSNTGPAAARNRGLAIAAAEFVAFTDDDCAPPANWLARLADGFRRHPVVIGVGGALLATPAMRHINLLARYEAFMARTIHGAADHEVIGGFECPAGGTNNIAYRAAALRSIGGFDEAFPYPAGEDADLKWRLSHTGARFLYTPVVVTHQQVYTWVGFRRQHFIRGQGQFIFERKWGQAPNEARILGRIAVGWLRAVSRLKQMPEAALLLPALVEVWCNALGQWCALSEQTR